MPDSVSVQDDPPPGHYRHFRTEKDPTKATLEDLLCAQGGESVLPYMHPGNFYTIWWTALKEDVTCPSCLEWLHA